MQRALSQKTPTFISLLATKKRRCSTVRRFLKFSLASELKCLPTASKVSAGLVMLHLCNAQLFQKNEHLYKIISNPGKEAVKFHFRKSQKKNSLET